MGIHQRWSRTNSSKGTQSDATVETALTHMLTRQYMSSQSRFTSSVHGVTKGGRAGDETASAYSNSVESVLYGLDAFERGDELSNCRLLIGRLTWIRDWMQM